MADTRSNGINGLIVAVRIVLPGFAVMVLLGMILLISAANQVAVSVPEFAYLEIPFLLAGLLIGLCIEVATVVAAVLAGGRVS